MLQLRLRLRLNSASLRSSHDKKSCPSSCTQNTSSHHESANARDTGCPLAFGIPLHVFTPPRRRSAGPYPPPRLHRQTRQSSGTSTARCLPTAFTRRKADETQSIPWTSIVRARAGGAEDPAIPSHDAARGNIHALVSNESGTAPMDHTCTSPARSHLNCN